MWEAKRTLLFAPKSSLNDFAEKDERSKTKNASEQLLNLKVFGRDSYISNVQYLCKVTFDSVN